MKIEDNRLHLIARSETGEELASLKLRGVAAGNVAGILFELDQGRWRWPASEFHDHFIDYGDPDMSRDELKQLQRFASQLESLGATKVEYK